MDVQTYTEYEIVVPETNRRFTTRERYEAVAYYRDSCLVFERHVTVHNPTLYFQTRMIISRPWHNNPDFQEED
jgi:histone acetyltransferase (RNA polymerase elongator complex component)